MASSNSENGQTESRWIVKFLTPERVITLVCVILLAYSNIEHQVSAAVTVGMMTDAIAEALDCSATAREKQRADLMAEMDKRTATRDQQYGELKQSIEDLTRTVNAMRDDMIRAGILTPGAMRPIGSARDEPS